MDQAYLRSCYRQFVRYGLRAVQYRSPQKYVYMNALRKRFRQENPDIEKITIENTIQFVKDASLYNGIESQVLLNMVHVDYGRQKISKRILQLKSGTMNKKKQRELQEFEHVYDDYDYTVQMLNKSMNLAL